MEPLPLGRQAALETPSGLAARLRQALAAIGGGWVEGEVRGLRVSARGHAYLDLCDAVTTLHCVVWRGTWQNLRPRPEEGSLVQARFARVDLYPPSGNLALVLEEVRATGEGELLRRQAETLARLAADGLLEPGRKPALPRFPRRVGIVAGADSDALADVVKAIRDRFPPQRLVVQPATVQGTGAVDSVVGAIATLLGKPGVEVIVVARGGGSVQDLHPFSDERLCRAIAACPVPVVTSIGHTRQRPNCDHVAAASADVPGRTAELVVPSAVELAQRIGALGRRVADGAGRRLAREGAAVSQAAARVRPAALDRRATEVARLGAAIGGHRPPSPALLDGPRARLAAAARRAGERLERGGVRADECGRRADGAASRHLARAAERLEAAHGHVTARDAIGRGFAAVLHGDGRAVGGVGDVADGERLRLVLRDGTIGAEARLDDGDGRGA